jgi:uncharacterized protein (TIGR03435 family)
MRNAARTLALLILVACAGVAQTFEVASVKLAPPPSGRMTVGMTGGPGSTDPTRVRFSNFTLRNLVQIAYGVNGYQLSGPDWTGDSRYEVIATLPKDTSKEQFRTMLQNLLKERFKLATHSEQKTMALYSLTVAKGGPKLLKPAPDAPAADTETRSVGSGPPKRDKDGYPDLPPGTRMAIKSEPNGDFARAQGHNETMSYLVRMLSGQVRAPVEDDTGLTEKYDYRLSWIPQPAGSVPPDNEDIGPDLFTALQEQLGLKLSAKKGPVEVIVIDHAEKVPVEN